MKLYPEQVAAVEHMRNGCILNGGVGSGKSITSLYYYFKEHGGFMAENTYVPMRNPKDLYIITTAAKRDKREWEGELLHYRLAPTEKQKLYSNKVVIDSWQNIKKYSDVKDSFFIFDEDKVTGYGVWVKAFLKIAKSNEWIILSATPGDCWADYIPVFIANGFYKNKTEFVREHVIYSRFTSYPQIDRYVNTKRLERLRDKILIDIDIKRHTTKHYHDIYCGYNKQLYKDTIKNRWDPYKDEPIQQAAGLCYTLRRIVNSDESRVNALLEFLDKNPKTIIFYNFDYEREVLLHVLSEFMIDGHYLEIAEWSGHAHQPVPESDYWAYLVQYTAGCEGWNCIRTDTIIFYSLNYSYKVLEQASGRIDRLNTPFNDLYYYTLKSRSGIDLAIGKAISTKKKFNERKFVGWG